MPSSTTLHGVFNRKTLPLFLCSHCDAFEIEQVLERHGTATNS